MTPENFFKLKIKIAYILMSHIITYIISCKRIINIRMLFIFNCISKKKSIKTRRMSFGIISIKYHELRTELIYMCIYHAGNMRWHDFFFHKMVMIEKITIEIIAEKPLI